MRNKLIKIALAASIVLAWALTFSCSSDEKESWLTCSEAATIYAQCTATGFQSGCTEEDEECPAAEKCITDSNLCGSASLSKCSDHYMKECFPEQP
jgi:hypothetical protein